MDNARADTLYKQAFEGTSCVEAEIPTAKLELRRALHQFFENQGSNALRISPRYKPDYEDEIEFEDQARQDTAEPETIVANILDEISVQTGSINAHHTIRNFGDTAGTGKVRICLLKAEEDGWLGRTL